MKNERILLFRTYLLWTLLSFIIVYFYESAISPRDGIFGADSSVFKTIARSWIDGNIPYRDLFDHKGPYLYLFNVIGLSLSENWGLYLLASINLSIVTCFLWLISRNSLKDIRQQYACICFFLACYICVNDGGNMTESWSLPFCVIPLYLYHSDILNGYKKLWHNIVYGACFGIVAFIRINNGIIPASIILVLFIEAIRDKDFKLMLKQIGLQIAGLLFAILPAILYFSYHGALDDLIYANYIFNIEYMSKWATIICDSSNDMIHRIVKNFLWLFPLAILLIWNIWDIITKSSNKQTMTLMLIISCGVIILANWQGMDYRHYYITFLPLIFMLSIKAVTQWKSWKNARRNKVEKAMIVLSILWGIAVVLPGTIKWTGRVGKDIFKFGVLHRTTTNKEKVKEIEEMILCNVPNEEINNIYNMGSYVTLSCFVKLHKCPAGKYFFRQPELYKVSSVVADEIDNYHNNANPAYILTDKANLESNCSSFMIMLDNYQLIDSTRNSAYLYKRNVFVKPSAEAELVRTMPRREKVHENERL